MPMQTSGRAALAAALLALGLAAIHPLFGEGWGGATAPPVVHSENRADSAAAESRHYVVLVSLDGFRWDYAKRDGAAHLLALGKEGAWAPEGMLPSYPSQTFPNQVAMVTGLYPEHNGIVANNFFDPERQARFAMADAKDTADGTWYSGVPLWSLAETQGMRTACIFWPGCDAEIAGYRPTYSVRIGGKMDDAARVRQVLLWLRLPAAERPHFIAVCFSEPGRAGEEFGPDAPQTEAAVRRMDAIVGELKAGLDKTGLPIDLVVVSGAGMAKAQDGWITLGQYANLTGFETDGDLLYGKTEQDRERVYNELKHVSSLFMVYRRKNVPADLHYNANPREGDPVAIATGPYAMRAQGPEAGHSDRPPTMGMHGFDPRVVPEMKAIFFAAGPDIVPGKTVAPFDNVNLYPWISHILGLKAPKSDGSLNVLAGTLRDDGVDTASR
ncbi:MAG: ectonucleotide pyrophosphatase/phosphodiesterase [Terracidiphilus sp.]